MDSDGAHLRYDVTIRQQPLHARISAMKISDRRPVDPPIIVQLFVSDRRDMGSNAPPSRANHRSLTRHSHLTNPYYFMYAALVETNNDNEVKYIGDDGRPSTSGSLISSVRVLKDHPNSEQDAAFFIFPNICVRVEGSWRFKLSLFVIDGDKVKSCATTYSAPFFVYLGKQYPGVQVSTPLTRALAAQGVKLRIRKEVRERTSGRPRDEETPIVVATREDTSSPSSGDSVFSQSPPKRRRTLMSPIDGLHAFDSSLPSDVSNVVRIPRQLQILPAPSQASPIYPSEKPPQYNSPPRRASLDAQTLQRPYPSRDWFTPRSVEDYQSNLPQPFAIPMKLEPDYAQWGLQRPAHPSPEATQMLFDRQISPPDSEQRPPAYSWTSETQNRDYFAHPATPPTNPSLQQPFSVPSSNFWQMGAVPRQRGLEQPARRDRPNERYPGRPADLTGAEFDWSSQ
ncbi:velvet factor-domain-containing protein [Mycena metata]|uniref:Velvet factor-domain-containing protein n=1 Tax=Mycena metata TaxID=1033252 RepID=A0AAD7JCE9_9AGAR|nr:velvet factor-domain-containing protein [Mycena metata]